MKAENLWQTAWKLVEAGQQRADHPFRTPVVSSVSPTLHPRSRTVILRHCLKKPAELWFYTDRRSAKATDLATAATDVLCWTFWDADAGIQFTGSGPSYWVERSLADAHFRKLPKHGRKAYASVLPPGTRCEQPQSGLPEDWEMLRSEETEYVRQNFGILATRLREVDILRLDRSGNLRLRGQRQGDDTWQFAWIIP